MGQINYASNKKYKCEICGREMFKKIRLRGYTLCPKHMHQLLQHGEFLDNIPRTNSDLNDYTIVGNEAFFNVYKQDNTLAEVFVIDAEDVEKVKYKKWRMSCNHVVTGRSAKGEQQDLSHVILGVKPNGLSDFVVDHIDGNPLNNKKSNLRKCYQGANTINKSCMRRNTSGFIGVSPSNRGGWTPEISINWQRCHLGRYRSLAEAVYARYIAEELIFKDMCNEQEHTKKKSYIESLSANRKAEIADYVINKLGMKNMLAS